MSILRNVLFVYLLSFIQLWAIDIPERLQKWAMQTNSSIGTFVLEKEIADIGVSVKSIGNYKFEKHKGITWNNIYPTKFTFFANDKYYSITTPQSTKKHDLNQFDINKAIDLLFKGDTSDFQDKFDVTILENTTSKISIKCIPKHSQIKTGLKSIVVDFGIKTFERCYIELANDIIIKIELKQIN